MALDVHFQPSPSLPISSVSHHVVSFDEDEGYYWFLYPLFQELFLRTGQDIDLYGEASFYDASLDEVVQTLQTACTLTQSQPENWDVVTGELIEPLGKTSLVKVPVERQNLLAFLAQLQAAVNEARQQDQAIVFFGD